MTRIEPVKPVAKFRNPIRTKRNSMIIGAVIVVASVLVVNLAVKSLSGSHEYLVVDSAVAAGTPLNEVATRTISLNLGQAAADYLAPNSEMQDLVLTQPLSPGDLLMKRDLTAANPNDEMLRLALSSKTALPSSLVAGDRIDLWAAVNDGSGQFEEPELIAQNIQVANDATSKTLFGESANRLEVQVNARDVKPILAAVLRGDAVSVALRSGVN